jgi:photosystem II stability/assembly factor-like uncharacterized protein
MAFLLWGQEGKQPPSTPPAVKAPPATPDTAKKTTPKPRSIFSPWFSVKHLEAEIAFRKTLFPEKAQSGVEREILGHPELENYREAYLYWLRQRSFPYDTINWSAYLHAFTQQALMLRATFRLPPHVAGVAPPQPPTWEFLGPTQLPVPYRQYYGEGFNSGRVNGIAIDPKDSKIIYLAAAGGGLWRTVDKGQTWTPLSDTDQWDNTKVSSVAIDSTNSQTVYVGTGDFDGGAGVYGFGIMKTTNGGQVWTNIARRELKGFSVRRILIDPDDPTVITAAAGRNPDSIGRLVRSDDGGQTWRVIPMSGISGAADADWEDVKCGLKDTSGERYCYAVGASDGGQVLRTSDKGLHWVKLHPPLSPNLQKSLAIATSPTTPGTLYLLSGTDRIVLKSVNDGDSWSNITGNLPPGPSNNNNWGQSEYDFFIESSRRPDTGQDVIYVGLVDLLASWDGGESWTSVGLINEDDKAHIHSDQHCLAVNSGNPNEVLLGNDGGAYVLTFKPSQNQWTFDTSLNAQLGLTQFYSIAADPTGNAIVLGGAQDNATPIALGDFSKWSNIGGGDGGYVLINPAKPDVQYATAQYLTIYQTSKSWRDADENDITFTQVVNKKKVLWLGDPVSFVAPVALDPNDPDVLYAGTNYLWRRDATGNWEPHLGSQMLAEKSPASAANDQRDALSVIAVAPSDSNTIYTGSQMGQLWMTNNKGKTWKQVSSVLSGLPRYSITSIAVHPTDARTFIVGLSGTSKAGQDHPGHVWKCTSTTSSLRCQKLVGASMGMLPNIPVNRIVIDPESPDKLYYVATDVGVFMSKDGGMTWGDATKPLGLPNVQVNDLKLIPGTGYLLAATFGRGAWRIKDLSTASLKPRPMPPASNTQGASAAKPK